MRDLSTKAIDGASAAEAAMAGEASSTAGSEPTVLVLTPMKNASAHLADYIMLLERLDWPRDRLSLGILEGDSDDGTATALQVMRPRFDARFSRTTLVNRDYGFHLPPGVPRWSAPFQLTRRSILARARNQLLFRALGDEDWVLWIDADLVDYPADVLRRLLATGFDIVTPHCVKQPGGPSFDLNAWGEHGTATLAAGRGGGAVRLDAVGGTMLLVRANLHRDGLIFPPFPYGNENPRVRPFHPLWGRGEVETEGFGLMAADMGIQCWGLPDLEIIHAEE
jgi:peptide chain release factor subunit 1